MTLCEIVQIINIESCQSKIVKRSIQLIPQKSRMNTMIIHYFLIRNSSWQLLEDISCLTPNKKIIPLAILMFTKIAQGQANHFLRQSLPKVSTGINHVASQQYRVYQTIEHLQIILFIQTAFVCSNSY